MPPAEEDSCRTSRNDEFPSDDSEEETNRVYDTVYVAGEPQQAEAFRTTLRVNDNACTGLLDTGATRTLITADIVTATRPSTTVLKAYDRRQVTTLRVADVTIKAGTKSCTYTCFVVPVGQTIRFGQDVIRQLKLLSINEANMIKVNPIGITVDPQVAPVALPPIRHAFSLRNEIEAELERLQQADVIEPVRQATSWLSLLAPVRKANGTLRLCVDYWRLNKAIVRERHMLPTLDEITATLEGATVFSVLNAESGFHQVPLDIESRHYTTFTTHRGLYRLKRLPFGVACAPEIFQRVVDDILQGLDGVIVYIDDIFVFGRINRSTTYGCKECYNGQRM